MKVKERLDKILVNKGFVESSSKAKALIMSGKIIVNGKKIEKAGVKFSENINVRVLNKQHEWVSRGGVKLSNAIKKFDVEINEKVCVDIGASTGGFTEVLLKNNAKHVYCIDVGRGQLDWKLTTNKKVTIFDRTNARNVDLKEIQKKKTSLLIAFCTLTGAIIGNATKKEQKQMFDVGLLIGSLFQMQDDILDQEGNEEEMGKKVHKDKDLNKATIIRLKDINYAKKEVINVGSKIKKKLLLINKNTKKLIKLTNFLMHRTS